MGDVVNLQQYRKKLKRERAARQAVGNRARNGRNRSERRRLDTAQQRLERELDGKRLERRRDEDEPPRPA